MKVTIITATCNSENYLEESIKSVISQQYKNIEHIIIDCISSDNTLGIIKKYESHIDKWICEPDYGIYDGLNKGMKLATGDIIGVLHSDDWLASPDVIEEIVKSFQTHDVGAVYGDLEYVYANNINKTLRVWKGNSYRRSKFKFGWMPAHPTFYIKKTLVEKYGGYESHYLTAADYEFMTRYLYKLRIKAFYLPKLIVKMRAGGASNRSIYQRLRANRRDYLAMKKLGIPFPFIVSLLKPIIKLHQFYWK